MTTSNPDAAASAPARAEASLLVDALGVDPAQLSARTREPLGRGSVAGFDVSADGDELRYFVDTSRYAVAAETGLALGDPAAPDARVWLHPADPHLPALPAAAFGHAAESLLARLGIIAVDRPALVAYRPGRRAVLRVPTATGIVWIKVVRPSRVARIAELHARLGDGGVPVPRVLGWAPEGLIVIDDARGTGAPDVAWEPDRLLEAVDRLRGTLAGVTLSGGVQGAASRLPWYAERVGDAAAGTFAHRVSMLIEHLGAECAASPRPETTVHGDLHFGQLFLGDDGEVSSVIDVDTAGRGDPGEDSAAFIAHAVASAVITATPAGRERVWWLADAAHDRWGGAAATPLTAVHLVGHAIGALDRADGATAGTLIAAAEAIMSGRAPSSARDKSGLIDNFETA